MVWIGFFHLPGPTILSKRPHGPGFWLELVAGCCRCLTNGILPFVYEYLFIVPCWFYKESNTTGKICIHFFPRGLKQMEVCPENLHPHGSSAEDGHCLPAVPSRQHRGHGWIPRSDIGRQETRKRGRGAGDPPISPVPFYCLIGGGVRVWLC